jgi:predicted NBD/HSP70 family sugar kinase
VLTVDTARMREHNSALLLNLLFKQQGLSRADLSRMTGLSRSTVSAIIDALIEEHLVKEVGIGVGDAKGGRRPTLLEFNDDAFAVVGIELGATHVHVVVTNLRAKVRASRDRQHAVIEQPSSTLAILPVLIRDCLREAKIDERALLGIGVAVPCPLDLGRPEQLDATLMPAWQGVDLGASLREHFDCPVNIDNDANLGALAERWWGAGTSGADLTFVKIATGVGAGHIINGDVYRGSNGTAGEIGHLAIDLHGPPCRCGLRGCLAALVGADALRAKVTAAVSSGQTTSLGFDRSPGAIAKAAADGDPLARLVVGEAGAQLGVAIASLLNLLNPAIVVLGGPLTDAGALLLDPIRDTVRHRSLFRSVAEARIVTSELGEDSIAIGAATLMLQAALRSPALFDTSPRLTA